MEIDIWLPNKSLCFEFQDAHHYVTTWYHQKPTSKVWSKDTIKQAIAQNHGYTLIVIPCWWDGNLLSLAGTIKFQRPDLISLSISSDNNDNNEIESISLNPPSGFFSTSLVSQVGELMLASFPDDSNFINTIPPNYWWIGEKYDGIRVCWNPGNQLLNASQIALPRYFLSHSPSNFVDGELWFGRQQYRYIFKLLNEPDMVPWHQLRMIGFDVPSNNFQNFPFEERYFYLLQSIPPENPFMEIAQRALCKDSVHAKKILNEIIKYKGEGAIMRKIASTYKHGRNRSLVKLKDSYGDGEAVVVGIRNEHLELKLPNGNIFTIASNKNISPSIGDVVTFSYERHARRELPYQAKLVRIRNDVSWEYIMKEHEYNESSSDRKHVGYWTQKNMKEFLESFAKSRNMDPSIAATWYSCYSELIKLKSAMTIVRKFNGNFGRAIQSLFPEIQLDEKYFRKIAYWGVVSNRRKFFEQYAKQHGFDFRNPEHWYSHPKKLIYAAKNIRGVIEYHKQSIPVALFDLFPEIGFEKSKLLVYSGIWRNEDKRKKFFLDFAKEKEFDPYDPQNWYSQSRKDILAVKGAAAVIVYHENSLPKALFDLFPNIGLEISKFETTAPRRYDFSNRRKFFEEYATRNGFDYTIPENWYNQSKQNIKATKGVEGVLRYHNNDIVKALLDIFPEIGLDEKLFKF